MSCRTKSIFKACYKTCYIAIIRNLFLFKKGVGGESLPLASATKGVACATPSAGGAPPATPPAGSQSVVFNFKAGFGGQRGSALILTLLVTSLLVVMVVEFAYKVYVSANSLYEFRDGQELSVLAASGIDLGIRYIDGYVATARYTELDKTTIPFGKVSENADDTLSISVGDENARFNVNTIVYPNGTLNQPAFDSFQRLLRRFSIDESVALYIADWIDRDSEERVAGSEKSAKNSPLFSIDELLLVSHVKKEDYKKLAPFVTVYGSGLVNVNTALPEVLECLSPDIDEALANRIVQYRKSLPFDMTSSLLNVPGMEQTGKTLLGRITVKSDAFTIISSASLNGLTKDVAATVIIYGTNGQIKYWKEY
ncbi:MAG: type II secretion system minor pseudopilin GspK [Nitrospirae bacterium]|nr:type II secretion system minor pseudopilin GspK [Nitrospirota bacterium]